MTPPHNESEPTVAVIDDDKGMRDALHSLLRSVGLRVELFGSAQEFLDRPPPAPPSCLILDVRLPERNGLDFHDDLIKANVRLPVVFISGHADVAMSVRAMKAGAIEFLTKPLRPQDLVDAIQLAIEQDRTRRVEERSEAAIRSSFESLTARERQVMALVVDGNLNRQIAAEMSVSEATVKQYRGQLMRKMNARSVVDLVRMADRLGAARPNS